MTTIAIVTPWLDHPELIPAYEAAVAGARVIVVNQASERETTGALCAMIERLGRRSAIIMNETNTYFARANNQGFSSVEEEVVVFLNNDVVGTGDPPNRWLAQLVADVQPGGLYGPTIMPFDVDGEPCPYVEGWCLAATTDTLRCLEGPWNTADFPRAYAEDVEFSWRARRAGLSLYQTRWPIRHIGNVTNSTTVDGYTFADQQRERFRQLVRAARGARGGS